MQAALEQAAMGKGEKRHGHGKDFLDQPWLHYANVHGHQFLTGQAVKKVDEAIMNEDDIPYEAWEREMLGAMVYIGMAVLHRSMRVIAARQGFEQQNPGVPVSLMAKK